MHYPVVLSSLALLASTVHAEPEVEVAKRMPLPCPECQVEPVVCPGNAEPVIIKVVTYEDVVHYKVPVDQYCPENTVITCDGGEYITVDNAPTHVLTVVDGVSKSQCTDTTTVYPGHHGKNIHVYEVVNEVNFPVYISTYIEANTIFNINGDVNFGNIIINNAPTTLVTTATGTSTVTSTVTSTATSNGSNGSNGLGPTAFLLSPLYAGGSRTPNRKARREISQYYLDASGRLVSDCNDGAMFSIVQGQLRSGTGSVSTNEGTKTGPFAVSDSVGNINITFVQGSELAWNNGAFSGGAARFCATINAVFSLFTGDAFLASCEPVRLITIADGFCAENGQVSPSSSASGSGGSGGSSTTSGAGGSETSGASGSMTSGAGGSETSGASGSMTSGAGGSETSGASGSMTSGAGGSETSGASGSMTSGAGGSETSGASGSMTSGSASSDARGSGTSDSGSSTSTSTSASATSSAPATECDPMSAEVDPDDATACVCLDTVNAIPDPDDATKCVCKAPKIPGAPMDDKLNCVLQATCDPVSAVVSVIDPTSCVCKDPATQMQDPNNLFGCICKDLYGPITEAVDKALQCVLKAACDVASAVVDIVDPSICKCSDPNAELSQDPLKCVCKSGFTANLAILSSLACIPDNILP